MGLLFSRVLRKPGKVHAMSQVPGQANSLIGVDPNIVCRLYKAYLAIDRNVIVNPNFHNPTAWNKAREKQMLIADRLVFKAALTGTFEQVYCFDNPERTIAHENKTI